MTLPEAPEPLPSQVVDTHCHLDITSEFSGLEPAEAITRAAQVGVPRIVQIGCDVEQSRWAVRMAQTHDALVAGVAIHPNEAAALGDGLGDALEAIEALVGEPGVRAVGETGLDYYRTTDEAGHRRQWDAFSAHIWWAQKYDRTLVIHDRDAHNDVLALLRAENPPDRIVMHCFSGDADFARACLDLGAYLSFAGTVTFKNNPHLRRALAVTPLDRVLVETDAPFLTPTPLRGRPNASYLVPHTVRAMAALRDSPLEQLCAALDRNAEVAFGGSW